MTRKLSHRWTVENFSAFFADNKIAHPFIFTKNISPNEQLETYLEICPKGEDSESEQFISVFVNFESYSSDITEIDLKIAIVNRKDELCFVKETGFTVDKTKRLGWPKYVARRELQADFLENDKLTIFFQLQIQIKNNGKKNISNSNLFYKNRWIVPNFRTLFGSNNPHKPVIQSDKFSLATEDEHQFYLTLSPAEDGHVSLFLRLDRCVKAKLFIRFSATVINGNFDTHKGQWKISRLETCGFQKFASLQSLLEQDCFQDSVDLVLCYKVEILDDDFDFEIISSDEEENGSFTESVTNAMQNLVAFTHRWTIEDFGQFLLPRGVERELNRLESASFGWPIDDTAQFYLKVQTKADYLSAHLWFDACDRKTAQLYYRLSILGSDGKKCVTMGCQVLFDHESILNWGWYLISIQEIQQNLAKLLQSNERLTILCEIEILDHNALDSSLGYPLETLSWYCGGAKLSKLAHCWTVEDMKSFLLNENNNDDSIMSIYSDNFTTPNKELQFYLMYSKRETILFFASHNAVDVHVRCKLSILNSDKTNVWNEELSLKFRPNSEHLGLPFQLPLENSNLNDFLRDDALQVLCEINAIEFPHLSTSSISTMLDDYFEELKQRKYPTQLISQSFTKTTDKPINFSDFWEIDITQNEEFNNLERWSTISEVFKIQECENLLELRLKLCFDPHNNNQFVSIYLEVTSLDPALSEVNIRWNIALVNCHSKAWEFRDGRWKYVFGNDRTATWGWSNFISRNDLFNPLSGYINQDKIKLSFNAIIFLPEASLRSLTSQRTEESDKNDASKSMQIYQNPTDSRTSCTKITKIVHHWKVENFCNYLDTVQDRCPYVKSASFPAEKSNQDIQFYLRFYPFGDDLTKAAESNRNIAFYLLIPKLRKDVHIFHYKLSLLNGNEKKFNTIDGMIKSPQSDDTYGLKNFYPRNELFNLSNDLLTDDTLRIVADFYLIQSSNQHDNFAYINQAFTIPDFEAKHWKAISLESSCITKNPSKHKLVETFEIDNFTDCSSKESGIFSFDGLNFQLKLQNNQNWINQETTEEKFKVFLKIDYHQDRKVKLRFTLSLMLKNGHKFDFRVNKIMLLHEEKNYVHLEEFKVRDIFMQESDLLVDNKLIIHCEIDIFHKPETIELESFEILDSLEHLIREKQRADFALELKDASSNKLTRLYAHKAVLSQRCNYFKVLFSYESCSFQEIRQNSLKIKDFESDVGEGLLWYFYTGKIRNMKLLAVEYFLAADKYEIPKLQYESENWITGNLSIQTVCHLLALAHKHHSDILKLGIFPYFHRHYDHIVQTVGFQQLTKEFPSLFIELYTDG